MKRVSERLASRAALVLALLLPACDDALGPDGAGYPQLPEPSVVLTPGQQQVYDEDAVRLAVRHLIVTGSSHRHDVEPPHGLVTSIRNALLAVHASTGAVRDTVIDVYRIRAFPDPPVREILVVVDPAAPWIQPWREGQALTGNAAVDALVQEYGISVVQFYHWSIGWAAVLRTDRPVNTIALAGRFAPLAGVRSAEPNGHMGDGNDIRAVLADGRWRLSYTRGWGDCMAGCINRVAWTFAVDRSGAVRYLGFTAGVPNRWR